MISNYCITQKFDKCDVIATEITIIFWDVMHDALHHIKYLLAPLRTHYNFNCLCCYTVEDI